MADCWKTMLICVVIFALLTALSGILAVVDAVIVVKTSQWNGNYQMDSNFGFFRACNKFVTSMKTETGCTDVTGHFSR